MSKPNRISFELTIRTAEIMSHLAALRGNRRGAKTDIMNEALEHYGKRKQQPIKN